MGNHIMAESMGKETVTRSLCWAMMPRNPVAQQAGSFSAVRSGGVWRTGSPAGTLRIFMRFN